MNILIACEESQVVCSAFRENGFNAFSCDILPTSGRHPEWHIQADVLSLLDGHCSFFTCDYHEHFIPGKWDLIIAHPPCTYLTVTGNSWFNEEKYGDLARKRKLLRESASQFFMRIVNADCARIAVENPIGVMSSLYRKPDQYIQPYFFGDPFEKKTCLWLKNLPILEKTNVVLPPERKKFASGVSMPAWYADLWNLPKEERSRMRSKTFPGFANAVVSQWGKLL